MRLTARADEDTHRHMHNPPSVFIKPPHTLTHVLSLSLSHTKTHAQPCYPLCDYFFPFLKVNTHTGVRAFLHTDASYFLFYPEFRFPKLQKSEHINEPNAGESGKQAREGGRAACLSVCSMATIVHCTFSEPTRAEAISTQILWRDSKPRSERGSKWER